MAKNEKLIFGLKIYLTGTFVLLAAIALNLIAGFLKITTWYSFLSGRVSFSNLGITSGLFLFLVYPMLLGLSAYFSWNKVNRIFS